MRRGRYPIAALGAAVAVAVLFSAPSDARSRCAIPRGATVAVKSRDAVVFYGRLGGMYGCHRSKGRVFLLERWGDFSMHQLAGRYAAYVVTVEDGMQYFHHIAVFDLVRGRESAAVGGFSVSPLVLKRSGSIAWVRNSRVQPENPDERVYEVRTMTNDDGDMLVDRGSEIQPASLALSSDRRSVVWTKAGETRTAPLP